MMTREQANVLQHGARFRIHRDGLARHGLSVDDPVGSYVSQFDSPVHGRMIVVLLAGGDRYGFTLSELEIVAP